jgi:hypothetical protein
VTEAQVAHRVEVFLQGAPEPLVITGSHADALALIRSLVVTKTIHCIEVEDVQVFVKPDLVTHVGVTPPIDMESLTEWQQEQKPAPKRKKSTNS